MNKIKHLKSSFAPSTLKENKRIKLNNIKQTVKTICFGSQVVLLCLTGISAVHARGEVSAVHTENMAATPYEYQKGGYTYRWGQDYDLKIVDFVYNNLTYQYQNLADKVEIRRVGNTSGNGDRCTLFAEKISSTGVRNYKATYPNDNQGNGNCDMAKVMGGRTINLGALDVFSNVSSTDSEKHIERIDFIFTAGILAPTSAALNKTGHVATEKWGNNPVKIAAILTVDTQGDPASYGPLVLVNPHNNCSNPSIDICYGLVTQYLYLDFLANEINPPRSQPTRLRSSSEPMGMAFVSLEDLGVPAGSIYYGFSYFGSDTDTSTGHVLIDPNTFPLNSPNAGVLSPGDADMYGGVAGYFVDTECSIIDCPIASPGPVKPIFGRSGRFNFKEVNEIKVTEDIAGGGVSD